MKQVSNAAAPSVVMTGQAAKAWWETNNQILHSAGIAPECVEGLVAGGFDVERMSPYIVAGGMALPKPTPAGSVKVGIGSTVAMMDVAPNGVGPCLCIWNNKASGGELGPGFSQRTGGL